MLYRETVAVYCENYYMEHTDTLCGQTKDFYYVKEGGTYSNHWALKVKQHTRQWFRFHKDYDFHVENVSRT
jgi:5-methylcytosine-specific restriction endonuclease McrA